MRNVPGTLARRSDPVPQGSSAFAPTARSTGCSTHAFPASRSLPATHSWLATQSFPSKGRWLPSKRSILLPCTPILTMHPVGERECAPAVGRRPGQPRRCELSRWM